MKILNEARKDYIRKNMPTAPEYHAGFVRWMIKLYASGNGVTYV